MIAPRVASSPQLYARIGGIIYLIIIVAGFLGEIMGRGRLIVSGDAVATANNISHAEGLFRSSIAGDLIMHVCDIPLILIFYILLKPVSKNLALLATFFNLVQTAILATNKLTLLAALSLLENSSYLKAMDPHQLQALSYFFLEMHEYGFGIGLLFFGFRCLIVGYLIIRSGYFPPILGLLQAIAGLCYLINSFALFLAPSFESKLFPAILVPSALGELAMCLWLIVKGVNLPKWKERVRLAGGVF